MSVTLPGGTTSVALRSRKFVAAGGKDGVVWVWTLDPDEWRSIICRIANRNLTVAEQEKYLDGNQTEKACPELP